MRKTMTSLRDTVVAMIELIAAHRPDLLKVYLEMATDSPARFAVAELASDCNVREIGDLNRITQKIIADLDRLERRRGGWQHPKQVVQNPNIGGLLRFCRARIQNVNSLGRRRRLEVMARKLQRVHDREKTHAWITDFIGTSGHAGAVTGPTESS